MGVKTGVLGQWLLMVFLFFCYLIHPVTAQDPNNNYCVNPQGASAGGFTLDKAVICAGASVQITGGVPAGMVNIAYIKDYNGKGIPTATDGLGPSFQYTQPGSYTILQVGSINGVRAVACKAVTVRPTDPISFKAQSCLGRRVTITPDPTTLGQYDTYIIRWGDGSTDEQSRASMLANPAHTYNNGAPTTPNITVEGVYGTIASPICNSPQTRQSVTLLAAAAQPAITALTTTSDKSIEIKYQTSAGVSVQLYQKLNGTYSPTGQNGTGIGAFTVQTDATQVQCFQLVTQDVCNSTSSKSEEVCSLVLDVKAGNKENTVSWQPYAGTISGTGQFRYYRLSRNNRLLGATLPSRNANSYIDANNIICGEQYCYSIEATIALQSTQTIVTSANVCVKGINGDPPGDVGSLIVSVEDGHPRLITTPPATIGATDSYTMIVSRASGSGAFQPIASLDRKTTFTDESANASTGSYCYQVAYQNSCGLTSAPSKSVCTVFLTSKSAMGIDWNADSPFAPDQIASYTVEVADSINGTNGAQYPVGANTHFEPDPNDPNLQQQRYRIIVTSTSGDISYSNFFRFLRDVKFFVPDAFTPNGDGMNDEFLAKGIYVDEFLMTIYNRWGEVVYSTASKTKGWDGTTNGEQAPPGQYMYRIEIIDLAGLKTVRTGALLLIR
jgi:gliding motility-associated-like protein